MASLVSTPRDITQASAHRDNLTVVAARSVPATVTRPHPLPTPPNSISPALPPHGLKAQLQKAKLEPIDSDLDLQDDEDDDMGASPGLEATGAITAALLAKFHLPDILLNHGPLAIRHIMGYLTSSVPGFSGIPPNKARRLVVAALEGRGTEDGSLAGDVEFTKVGWGRWDARKRGQAARNRRAVSPASSSGGGIPIAKRGIRAERARLNKAASSTGDSLVFSHDDREISMLEDEADKMSLDGSASASCSEAPEDDMDMNDDPEDLTDDEDWAAIGAAALRADSYKPTDIGSRGFLTPHGYNAGGVRSFSVSTGMARAPQPLNLDFANSPFGTASNEQEREAVEALMRLGSV